MSENKKSQYIIVRVSPKEKNNIETRAKQSKMTVSQYILKVSENKKIIVAENIPELFLEITRIGVNINQIAHVANAQKYVNTRQIYEVKNLLREVQENMEKILRAFGEKETNEFQNLEDRMSALEKRLSVFEMNFDQSFYQVGAKLDQLISSAQKRVDGNGNNQIH